MARSKALSATKPMTTSEGRVHIGDHVREGANAYTLARSPGCSTLYVSDGRREIEVEIDVQSLIDEAVAQLDKAK